MLNKAKPLIRLLDASFLYLGFALGATIASPFLAISLLLRYSINEHKSPTDRQCLIWPYPFL